MKMNMRNRLTCRLPIVLPHGQAWPLLNFINRMRDPHNVAHERTLFSVIQVENCSYVSHWNNEAMRNTPLFAGNQNCGKGSSV